MPSSPEPHGSNPSDTDLNTVFATAPEQFVAARNELVAKLNASGNSKAASAIKGLPKPTLVVWVINQLARVHPELVESLLQFGDRLREVQARALRGKRISGDDFRAAAQSEREPLGALIRAAAEVLANAGRVESSGLLGRIESTLHAIAVGQGPERELLRAGRLSREVAPGGFPEINAASAAREETSTARNKSPRQRASARELETARAQERAARRAARASEEFLRKAEKKAQRLKAMADRAEQTAIRARAEAAAAQQQAATAKQAATRAQQELERTSARVVALTPGSRL